MSDATWSNLHKVYGKQDWINKPSLFADTARQYFPKTGKLLDLGAGVGQDSIYFSTLGYDVTATDLDITKLKSNVADKNATLTLGQVDLRGPMAFTDGEFDIVYAHLSLHYFDQQTTESIFSEIYRVLKPGGILAFFTNSTNDPEYNTGKEIEPDYFEIDGVPKRYLSVESARAFAHNFKVLLADNNGETFKDAAVGVHNLIRFIGEKAE